MARPNRDYAVAITKELHILDEKIRALALRRVRLQRMLEHYQAHYDINIDEIVATVEQTSRPSGEFPAPATSPPQPGRKKRPR